MFSRLKYPDNLVNSTISWFVAAKASDQPVCLLSAIDRTPFVLSYRLKIRRQLILVVPNLKIRKESSVHESTGGCPYKRGAYFGSLLHDNYTSTEIEVLHKILGNGLKQISNLIGHFSTVLETMLTLTLSSLFQCLTYAESQVLSGLPLSIAEIEKLSNDQVQSKGGCQLSEHIWLNFWP